MFPVSVKCKSDPWGEKVKRCAFTWLIARRALRCRTPSIPTSLLGSPSVVSVYDEQRCNSRWITELEKMSRLLLDWFSMLEQDTERPHRRCCSGRDRVWSMSSKEFSCSMNSWQSERDVVSPDWSSGHHSDIECRQPTFHYVEYSTLFVSTSRGNGAGISDRSQYWFITLLIFKASARYWIVFGLILFLFMFSVRRNWENIDNESERVKENKLCGVTWFVFGASANRFIIQPCISIRSRSNVVIVEKERQFSACDVCSAQIPNGSRRSSSPCLIVKCYLVTIICLNDLIQLYAHIPDLNQNVQGTKTIENTIDELDGEIHKWWNDVVRHSFLDVSLENVSISAQ